MSVTITNKLPTSTHIRLPSTGVSTPITGSGTLVVSDDDRRALLDDPNQFGRFTPGGDLSVSEPTPTGSPRTAFSATVDLTVSPQVVQLVPAVSGRCWVTRETRVSLVSAAPGVTAASVSLKSGGNVMEGFSVDATGAGGFNPLLNYAALQTSPGVGVDISVDTAATGGALSATFAVEGKYV